MDQKYAIILGVIGLLTVVRFFIARDSRNIHLRNAGQAMFLEKKNMAEVENSFANQSLRTMNVCTFVLIAIGTLMCIAFFNEEERPAQQDSVATHP